MTDGLPPAGWYPDPGGISGQYRYWNGRSWETRTATAAPAPPAGSPSGRRVPLLIMLGILIGAVVLLVAVGVRGVPLAPLTRSDPVPGPASSRAPANSSALPRPTAPKLSPQPSSTADAACPPGNPTRRSSHPNDGRVHGGALSFPALPKRQWADNPLDRFPVGYDIAGQSQQPNLPFFAILAVGALPIDDFSAGPRNATRTVLGCMLATAYVGTVTRTEILSDRRMSVDGATGWSIRARVYTDDPYAEGGGQLIQVIALDTDQPEALSFFYGAVWIGDDERVAILDLTVRSLTVG